MEELHANTEIKVRIGPFVDVGDGFTPQTDIGNPDTDLTGVDEAELLKHDGAGTVDLTSNTWVAITGCDGWYDLTLTTTDTNTEGLLTVVIQDDSDCLPVHRHFMVLAQAAWISKYTAKDSGYMDIDVKAIAGTATPNTSGKLHVLQGDGNAITAAGPTKTEMDNAIATIIADTENLQTILGTPANFMADLSTLETRLSATRAGYLDQLDFALQEAIAAIPTTAMRGTDNVVLAGPTKTEMDNGHAAIVADTEDLQGNVDAMHDTDLPLVKTDTGNIKTDTTAIIADTEDLQGNVDTMHDTDLPAVKTVVDAIQTDLGDFSGRTNNKSLLAVLGVPDTAGKDLHTLLVTDRLDHATYGLSAIETLVDQLEGYCDLIDDATNGLAAIKAEVEGIGGVAMRGTDSGATEAKQDIMQGTIDKLDDTLEDDGGTYRFTENA